MKSTNDFHGIVGAVLTEIGELLEEIDLVPKIITKRLNDSSSEEFRPFTEQEKKEFVNSLDDKGKRILAELEGKPKRNSRRKPRVASNQTYVSDAERTLFAQFGKLNVA